MNLFSNNDIKLTVNISNKSTLSASFRKQNKPQNGELCKQWNSKSVAPFSVCQSSGRVQSREQSAFVVVLIHQISKSENGSSVQILSMFIPSASSTASPPSIALTSTHSRSQARVSPWPSRSRPARPRWPPTTRPSRWPSTDPGNPAPRQVSWKSHFLPRTWIPPVHFVDVWIITL